MYNREELKNKLKTYSQRDNAETSGFVDILTKYLNDRLEDYDIYRTPTLEKKYLEDIVIHSTYMTMGVLEPIVTKYNVEKMCDEFEAYCDKLISVTKVASENDKCAVAVRDCKPTTIKKVSKIISRVSKSRVLYSPTYHEWKWFDSITEEINEVLNDKKLSKYKFDIEFISTDTMSIAEDDKFKVITVMYFKLTEYIPNKED